MDPQGIKGTTRWQRLPRSRGDGPLSAVVVPSGATAPPLTRGWTPKGTPVAIDSYGSPAHAGMDPRASAWRSRSVGLPRSRGDGPGTGGKPVVERQAPPLTRGWTQPFGVRACISTGSPAHAGMDPSGPRTAHRPGWLPRSRGDGPWCEIGCYALAAAPPLTRGWTLVRDRLLRARRGSPAHAGMDPESAERRSWLAWLPRSRGDGPSGCPAYSGCDSAPPLTRGWTLDRHRSSGGSCGSPAHAGMDPRTRATTTASGGLPRSRGDGPSQRDSAAPVYEAPPLTRGWTPVCAPPVFRNLGSPAHAGMDPRPSCSSGTARRLPRSRGDGPVALQFLGFLRQAPPLTRGWTLIARHFAESVKGSPAHAGMDPYPMLAFNGSAWLPRSRGDGPCDAAHPHHRLEAPPLTRGWTLLASPLLRASRGSPAHAGMDRTPAASIRRPGRLPRSRGDGPPAGWTEYLNNQAPPLTRGWTLNHAPDGDDADGSPAHAGMDPAQGHPCRRAAWLPRSRGDGPLDDLLVSRPGGAPPLTRGWTHDQPHPLDEPGGSPAHAGMDPGRCGAPS